MRPVALSREETQRLRELLLDWMPRIGSFLARYAGADPEAARLQLALFGNGAPATSSRKVFLGAGASGDDGSVKVNQELVEAMLVAAKSEIEKGRTVTLSFTPVPATSQLGRSTIFGAVNHVLRINLGGNVEIRLVGAKKLLAARGYPEQLLESGSEDDPVRQVMLANEDVTFNEAIRLAYPDRQR